MGFATPQVLTMPPAEWSNTYEYSHHVGIATWGQVFCGGSIISSLLVLTAAHCLKHKSPKLLTIFAGEKGFHAYSDHPQIRGVKAIYLHENYTIHGGVPLNDIGIILLERPFNLTRHVHNIPLPQPEEEFQGQIILSGWGHKYDQSQYGRTRLKKVMVSMVPPEECRSSFNTSAIPEEVMETVFCGGVQGTTGSCMDDTGGGVVCYRNGSDHTKSNLSVNARDVVLCGIVARVGGCDKSGLPSINAEVSPYIDWIEKIEEKIRERGRCRTHEFYCFNRCIPRTAICDVVKDCENGEDETGCYSYKPCERRYFNCDKGNCLNSRFVCNNVNNCGDDSDEFKCSSPNSTCTSDEHQCGASGRCIPNAWVCNGMMDCDDMSDEKNCAVNVKVSAQAPYKKSYSNLQKCSTEEFYCASGCISRKLVCNGVENCDDGSDEVGCIQANATACGTTYFRCDNGECIQRKFVCDGGRDCYNLSDELKCPSRYRYKGGLCAPREFQCGDGDRCIPKLWKCDGFRDCENSRDEWKCQPDKLNGTELLSGLKSVFYSDRKRCNTTQFYCSSECLPRSVICNGTEECDDGSDEIGCVYDQPCPSDRGRCNDGECVRFGCGTDIFFGCADGSDVAKCPNKKVTCSRDEFKCGPIGRCIPNNWRCNNMTDCEDGFDEIRCPWSWEAKYE